MTPLVDKYSPTAVDQFVGLEPVKKAITAFLQKPYPANFLYLGESGIGKTAMAFLVANRLNAEIHHLPSRRCDLQAVDDLMRCCQYLPMFGKSCRVAIVDEADQITKAAQLAFLSILDGRAQTDCTFLFTANSTEALEDRFLSRVRTLHFQPPTPDELQTLLRRVWTAEKKGRLKTPDFAAMARLANGNIRSALNTLEMELLIPGSFVDPVEASKEAPVVLYTIGVEKLQIGRLKTIISRLRITKLLDCRAIPTSRKQPAFSMTSLQKIFPGVYEWAGDKLGGNQSGVNEAGIKWLAGLLAPGNEIVMLLSKEKEPGANHRHHRIAVPLLEKFNIEARHIFENEVIETSELSAALESEGEYHYTELGI